MKTGRISSIVCGSLAAAGLSLLASCKKPVAEEAPPPAAPEPASAPAATPVAAPVTAATATPAPDPIAPPGVYFLVQKASIETADGIVGLKPGQLVRKVAPGTYECESGQLQLADSQVTNNLRVASQVANADAAAQAALRRMMLARESATPATPAAPATPATAPAAIVSRAPAAPAAAASAFNTGHVSTNVTHPQQSKFSSSGFGDADTENRKHVFIDENGGRYWRDANNNIRRDF